MRFSIFHSTIHTVYLPSASHNITEFNEYFDRLWALYDSLSAKWFVIVMGDFNGDLGNSLGDKAKHEPNQRGLKLLDFANYFNLCPVNLMGTCHGPTETYFSHCGRYRSTLDYIFLPNSLSEKIVSAKTFGMYVDNISDHVPVQVAINYTDSITSSNLVNEQSSIPKPKVHWTKFTKDEINENYTAPLWTDLLNINLDLLNGTENDVITISNLILTNSKSLAASVYHKKNKKKNYVSLPVDVKSVRRQCKATFEFGKIMASPPLVTYITSTAQSAESIVDHCVLSSIKLSQRKSKDFVLHLKPTKNYFGNL